MQDLKVSIQGKEYPVEFGMQALMSTCKELGLGALGVEELLVSMQNDPMETCLVLIRHCLKNTARKYKKTYDVTEDDLWLLFDDPEFVLVKMPQIAQGLLESMKIGEQAQSLLEGGDSKKNEETSNP